MSRHFAIDCLVCVLCAVHALGLAHTDAQKAQLSLPQDSRGISEDSRQLDDRLQALKNQIESKQVVKDTDEELGRDIERAEDEDDARKQRQERHVVVDESFFTKKILEAYGNGKSMSLKGFEKLLAKLRLIESIGKPYDREDDNVKDVNNNMRLNLNDDVSRKAAEGCISSKEFFAKLSEDASYFSETDNSTMLPGWLVQKMWPAIIYQLTNANGHECFQVLVESEPLPQMSALHMEITQGRPMAWQVWIYSTICITIITLCGIVGVVIMPAMDKAYYNLLIQFLVALAIGTLCGDALIHLIPHAMSGAHGHTHTHVAEYEHKYGLDHSSDYNYDDEVEQNAHRVEHEPKYGLDYSSDYDYNDEYVYGDEHAHSHSHGIEHGHSHEHGSDHDSNMWKGLVVVLGLIVFYFMEKGLEAISERRTFRRQGEPQHDDVKNYTDKYSLHPNHGDIKNGTKDNPHNLQHKDHQIRSATGEEKPLMPISNSLKAADENVEKKHQEKSNHDNADSYVDQTRSHAVIIRDHETKRHGHSHGNILEAGDSIANVAWMVIMGDGLHNFTDGIAIGAAFASGLPGGFSTAVAVFFHELPQELGDFAVLLKAGMSVKKAMFYNLLSGSTCYLGMVLGILLGELPSATGWIFAASAGSFIYIALVDMVPELGASRPGESGSKWYTPLHAIGLLSGAGIMLIIALYEHDLYNIIQ